MSQFKISRKRFNYILVFMLILVVVMIAIITSRERAQTSAIIVVTFAINITFSLICLLKSATTYYYSLDFIFWLFNLFFLSLIPLLQYFTNTYSWNISPTESDFVRTNLFITIWYVSYLFGRSFSRRGLVQTANVSYGKQVESLAMRKDRMMILVVGSSLITVYYLSTVGISGLMLRLNNDHEILNGTISLLTNHGFKNFVAFSGIAALWDIRARRAIRPRHMLLILFWIISCFPTGISRYMLAAMYGGAMIFVLKNKRIEKSMTLILLLGLVLIFPGIDIFRRITTIKGMNILETALDSISSTYLSGDYDAYQMFVVIQNYVREYGFSFGYQLLGALLFFVPRSVWVSKPYGTGQTAFVALNQHWFTNVSAPFISEAYVNFGVVGIVVFGILLGIGIKYIDYRYWKEQGRPQLLSFIYPSVLFMCFFFLRGDILSAYSYTFAQVFVGTCIYLFAVKKK